MDMNGLYRSILLLCMALMAGATLSYGQKVGGSGVRCDVGLLYQISYQESWGDSHAVVVEVIPGSPAARAGIRPGDVILEIEGRDTQKLSEETITAMILDPTHDQVSLKMRRPGTPSWDLALQKECLPSGILTEELLAQAFNMYSLEDVTSRRFTMPLIYTLPTMRDFIKYTTFSFADQESRMKPGARAVAKELTDKGLKELTTGGQLTIVYKTALESNPDYRAGSEANLDPGFRNYLVTNKGGRYEVDHYPFLSINTPKFSGKYRMTVDIEFIDSEDNTKVWSVTARELLNREYDADRYVVNFAYLMLANYPFVRYVMNPTFVLHRNQHLETGVGYNMDDLQLISYVAPGSPAAKAGLRVGDRIKSINGRPLESSVDKMSTVYKTFLRKTWKYRAKSTVYPDDNGFRQCMYWDPQFYSEVAGELDKSTYLGAFSYLFAHNPYIVTPEERASASGDQEATKVIFEVIRDGAPQAIMVQPRLINRDYVELK